MALQNGASKSLPRTIKVTTQDTGLKILVDKSNEADTIDIVAVHGRGAHPDHTWCRLREAGLNIRDPSSYINWLDDPTMLPAAVPNARIMRYGYDSAWYGPQRTNTFPRTISQDLLQHLHRERKKSPQRPLIFVAHSFGGLVVLQTLLEAHDEKPRWPDIYTSTIGLILFGTPLRGSDQEMQQQLSRLAEQEFGKDEVIEDALRTSQAGELLLGLVQRYLRVSRHTVRPKIACFYEQRPTNVTPIINKNLAPCTGFWVNESSSTLDVSDSIETYCRASCDHLGLNKFQSREDGDFKKLIDVMDDMVAEGSKIIKSRRQLPDDFSLPFSLHNIPVIDHFVERKAEMSQLDDALLGRKERVSRKVFVLHGMGGIGKTQLAANFIRTHSEIYSAVFWLDGSSEDAVRRSMADAAMRLPNREKPPLQDAETINADGTQSTEQLVKTFFDWLSLKNNTEWLLVYDNVDRDWQIVPKDPMSYDLYKYLPSADHGSIIVTTRLRGLQTPNTSMQVQKVDNCVSKEMIESRAGKKLQNVQDLIDKLGGLPLALAHAGAYLRMNEMMTVSKYLEFYDKTWTSLMASQHTFPLQEYPERSVLTTWKMSYDRIVDVEQRAANLLDLWAFFDPADVWYELAAKFQNLPLHDRISEDFLPTSELAFEHCISILSRYSLLTKAADGLHHSIHPVVNAWCLHNILASEKKLPLCGLALRMTAEIASPLGFDMSKWIVARRVLNHASVVSRRVQHAGKSEDFAYAYFYVAAFLNDWGQRYQAEPMYSLALEMIEKGWEPDLEIKLEVFIGLSYIYLVRGEQEKAEVMYQRTLDAVESKPAPEIDKYPKILHAATRIFLYFTLSDKQFTRDKILYQLVIIERMFKASSHI